MLSLQHISANCNPMPNTLTFLNTNTILFCFRDQVGVYQLDSNKILYNLNYRQVDINRANCICVINETTFVVGYDSGHLIVYVNNQNQWRIGQVLRQEGAITNLFYLGDNLITNNVLAHIKFFRAYKQFKKGQSYLEQFDCLKFPLNKIIQSFVQIQHKGFKLLFVGGIDQKIHCYTRQSNNEPLVYRFQLSGHENSITKLTITPIDQDYLLASASKDGYIRLWRLTQNSEVVKFHKNVKKIQNANLFCFLDAVLISHESSVTNLTWAKFTQKIQLVSCSLDCTICLWGVEKDGGAWTVDTRMGQFLGNKNAYFNIVCDQNYQYLVAVNYIGSALIWTFNLQNKKFTLRPSFNGHFNQVKDIDWDHTGNFLVSVSKDQTTRIVSRNNTDDHFHQISRAQVHGYDINAVSTIKVKQGLIDVIACGADQKVIRIVEPPACFANYLNYFTKANLHLYFPDASQEKKYIKSKPQSGILQYETYAEGGTQVLGLMTKVQRVQRQKISSYYDDQEQEAVQEEQNVQDLKYTKINFNVPPHDDYLVKHTLWPEMNKLYGHPHQISTLAKNNKRRLLASSCEGKNKIFCTIIIWNTQKWKIQKMIQYHSYTVYGMDFSECGKYFASVSKDRKLAIYDQNFTVIFDVEAHTRAITCVSFNSNSQLVATGSRDKSVKIHNFLTKQKVAEYQIKKQVDSITFCNQSTVAVGLIDGTIIVLSLKQGKLQQIAKVPDNNSHTKAVTKLRWNKGLLSSSSDDHSVRIFKLDLN